MKKMTLLLIGCLVMATPAFAVWPPSTAFQEGIQPTLFGYILVALVIGIGIGIWSQRNRHEHK